MSPLSEFFLAGEQGNITTPRSSSATNTFPLRLLPLLDLRDQ